LGSLFHGGSAAGRDFGVGNGICVHLIVDRVGFEGTEERHSWLFAAGLPNNGQERRAHVERQYQAHLRCPGVTVFFVPLVIIIALDHTGNAYSRNI